MDSRGADLSSAGIALNAINHKHLSLYRKYRPQRFSEIAGQSAAVDMLVSALSSSGIGHAYLFSGPRGCGKTTAARLLAKALNCLNNKNNNGSEAGLSGLEVEEHGVEFKSSPSGVEDFKFIEPCGHCENCIAITEGESLDVVEIDGASNNTVDEARELKSQANLAPFSSRYKIYIIDEVHMLSIAAFNALLKIMEEPPDYVIFILATTEPHKVPVTIRSRCQHIPFHRINVKDIFNQLTKICDFEHENIQAEPEALWEIARQADGGMRDALSMLEQVINTAKINSINNSANLITLKDVEMAVGAGSRPELEKWLAGLINRANDEDIKKYYIEFKNILEACTSPERVFEELFSIGRNLWLASMWPDIIDTLDVSEFENDFLKNYTSKQSKSVNPRKLKLFLNAMLRMIKQSRLDFSVDVLFGMFTLELDNIINENVITEEPKKSEMSTKLTEREYTPRTDGEVMRDRPNIKPETPREAVTARSYGDAQAANYDMNIVDIAENANVAEDFNFINSLDWVKFSDDEDKMLLDEARKNRFILYCTLLDAEFYKCDDKILLKFDTLHCYKTARIELNAYMIEDIIKLNLKWQYNIIYFSVNGDYYEQRIETKNDSKNQDNNKFKFSNLKFENIKFDDENNTEKSNDKDFKDFKHDSVKNSVENNVKEPKRYERTLADDLARVLGGQIVMIKSDDNNSYDEGDDGDNLSLNNSLNNDENDSGENED